MTPDGLRHRWQLAATVRVARDPAGQLYLVGPGRRLLGPESPALLDALRALAAGELPVTDRAATFDGASDAPTIETLAIEGWLTSVLTLDGTPLLTRRLLVRPVARAGPPDGPIVLSSLAVLHAAAGGFMLESAVGASVISIEPGPMLSLLGRLASPTTLAELTDAPPDEATRAIVEQLASDGFVVAAETGAEADAETEADAENGWSAHEAWFHARSRWGGRAAADYIGPLDQPLTEPAPVLRPSYGGPVLPLPRSAARPDDRTLTQVLEQRRSVRWHDDKRPITLDELSEFLERSAAISGTTEYEGVMYTRRPYPGGGTSYELELYACVRLVDGLAPGLYHYDPAGHALHTVPANHEVVDAMIERARITTQLTSPPQCLLVVSARFGRMLPRYQGMGYATILKDVGALYQTMYLVATALELAPCALGNGDTAMFAAATGNDYLTESSVGEFLLGSRLD